MYAAAGVQPRLNTIVQCVYQEAQWRGRGCGFGSVSNVWGKWEGILGQVLGSSFTLKFDSHD